MPNLEHVTWREPKVTPSDLAISSREIPSATHSLIFWMLAGVNIVAVRPRGAALICNVIVNLYDGGALKSVVEPGRFRVHAWTNGLIARTLPFLLCSVGLGLCGSISNTALSWWTTMDRSRTSWHGSRASYAGIWVTRFGGRRRIEADVNPARNLRRSDAPYREIPLSSHSVSLRPSTIL